MDSKSIRSGLKAAKDLISRKEWESSLTESRRILEYEPENYFALVFAGKCHSEMGNVADAEACYTSATEADPKQPQAWQGLAQILSSDGNRAADLLNVYNALSNILNDPQKCEELKVEKVKVLIRLGCYDEATILLRDSSLDGETVRKCVMLFPLERFADETWQFVKDVYTRTPVHQLSSCEGMKFARLLRKHDDPFCYDVCNELRGKLDDEDDAFNEDDAKECMRMLLLTVVEQVVFLGAALTRNQRNFVEEYLDDKEESDEELSPIDLCLLIMCPGDRALADVRAVVFGCQAYKQCDSNAFLSFMIGKLNFSCYDFWLAEKNFRTALQLFGLQSCTNVQKLNTKYFLCQCLIGQRTPKSLVDAEQIISQIDLSTAAPTLQRGLSIASAWILVHEENLADAFNVLQDFSTTDMSDDVELCLLTFEIQFLSGDLEKTKESLLSLTSSDCDDNADFAYAQSRLAKAEGRTQDMLQFLLKTARCNQFHPGCWFDLGSYYAGLEGQQFRQKATKCLSLAFQRNPRNSSYAKSLSHQCLLNGDEEKCLEVLTAYCSHANPVEAKWAWLMTAHAQLRAGLVDDAILTVQAVRRAAPEDLQVWKCLGESYSIRGSLATALKCFEYVLDLIPDGGEELENLKTEVLFQIAVICHKLSTFEKAIERFADALSRSQDEKRRAILTAYIHCLYDYSMAMWEIHRYAFSIETLHKLIQYALELDYSNHWSPMLWKIMGDVLFFMAKLPETVTSEFDLDKLQKYFENLDFEEGKFLDTASHSGCKIALLSCLCYRCLLSSFSSADFVIDYAAALVQCGSISEYSAQSKVFASIAVSALLQSVLRQPTPRGLTMIGNACVVLEEFAKAQHAFIKAIQLDRNDPAPWCNLGLMYLAKGRIDLAHECFNEAQAVDPTCDLPWIGQALTAERMDHEETIHLYRHAVDMSHEVFPMVAYARQVLLHLSSTAVNRSSLSYQYAVPKVHALPTARDCCQRLDYLLPKSSLSAFLSGCLLELDGLTKPALDAFQRGNELSESSPSQQQACKKALCRVFGKLRAAQQMRRLGGQMGEDDFSANVMRALAFARLGQFDKGEEFLSRCVYSADASQAAELRCAQALLALLIGGPDLDRAKSLLSDNLIPSASHPGTNMAVLFHSLAISQKLPTDRAPWTRAIRYSDATLLSQFLDLGLVSLFRPAAMAANADKLVSSFLQWLLHQFPGSPLTRLLCSFAGVMMPGQACCETTANEEICQLARCFATASDPKTRVQKFVHMYPDSSVRLHLYRGR